MTQAGSKVLTTALLPCARGCLHSIYHQWWESSLSTKWCIIQIQNLMPASAFLDHSWHQMSQVGPTYEKDNGLWECSCDKNRERRREEAELDKGKRWVTMLSQWKSQPSLHKVLKLGWLLRVVSSWDKGPEHLYPNQPVTGDGPPCKGTWLGQGSSLQLRQYPQGAESDGFLPAAHPASGELFTS